MMSFVAALGLIRSLSQDEAELIRRPLATGI